MSEKGAIDTAISPLSFTTDDKREGKTKVPHLMDTNEMLLKYEQDAGGNQNGKFLNFHVLWLNLGCSLQFSQQPKLAHFQSTFIQSHCFSVFAPNFSAPWSHSLPCQNPKTINDPRTPRWPSKLQNWGAFRVLPHQVNHWLQSPDKLQVNFKRFWTKFIILADTAFKPLTTLTLRSRINDIEVILTENSMRPDTSQALVLSSSCTADVDNEDGVQQVDGRVQGLQIVSTHFAHYSVLQKMDIILCELNVFERINSTVKCMYFCTQCTTRVTIRRLNRHPTRKPAQ